MTEEAPNEEGIKGKFKGKQGTMIISGKSRKKYLDRQGIEINDAEIIMEIHRGNTVISYHEEKQVEDTIRSNKDTKRLN
jgi:lipopolysaccharide export system protein LptA